MRLFGISVSCLALLGGQSCLAQSLPEGVSIGMGEAALRAAEPTMRRVPRPERLASGARGLWASLSIADAGLTFDVTYFLRDGLLERADLSLRPSGDTAGAYDRSVATLVARHGAALTSHQSAGGVTESSASWVDGDVDIAVHRLQGARADRLHVIYKQRVLRDAQTL